MATTKTSLATIKTRWTPQGSPDSPYIVPFLGGENIYIPCSKSATRLLVTGKKTNNTFAIVGSGGVAGAPIGFHFHREAHDIFLCLKGSVNVWAGDQCRTMTAGDFASVPPVCVEASFSFIPVQQV
jgi:mannose-6-phosphate isomerase-like protein (cupin superfamily)